MRRSRPQNLLNFWFALIGNSELHNEWDFEQERYYIRRSSEGSFSKAYWKTLFRGILDGDRVAGTYPNFYQGGEIRTRFVAFDLDMHDDDVTEKEVAQAFEEHIKPILDSPKYDPYRQSTVVTNSGRGLHIYILVGTPKWHNNRLNGWNYPSASSAYVFAHFLSIPFYHSWPGTVEVRPGKEFKPNHNVRAHPGMGIRLPFGIHPKHGTRETLLYGNLKRATHYKCQSVTAVASNVRKNRRDVLKYCRRIDLENQASDIRTAEIMNYVLGGNQRLQDQFPQFVKEIGSRATPDVLERLKPCLRQLVDPVTYTFRRFAEANNEMSHRLRLIFVRNFLLEGGSLEAAANCFTTLANYDQETTWKQIVGIADTLTKYARKTGCRTLRRAFANDEYMSNQLCRYCPHNGNNMPGVQRRDYIGEIELDEGYREVVKSDVSGREEMEETFRDLVRRPPEKEDDHMFFLAKTQRSGGTTSWILSCLEERKKLIFLVPNRSIPFRTLLGVDLQTGQPIEGGSVKSIWEERHPDRPLKALGLLDNRMMCPKAAARETSPEANLFPFCLQGDCRECGQVNDCPMAYFYGAWRNADIIFLTYNKLFAKHASDQASDQDFLDRLFEWADVVFGDEISGGLLTGLSAEMDFSVYLGEILNGRVPLSVYAESAMDVLRDLAETEQEQLFLRFMQLLINRIKEIDSDIQRNELRAGIAKWESTIHKFSSVSLGGAQDELNAYAGLKQMFHRYTKHLPDGQAVPEIILQAFEFAEKALEVFGFNQRIYVQRRLSYGRNPRENVVGMQATKEMVDVISELVKENDLVFGATDGIEPPVRLDRLFAEIGVQYIPIGDPMNAVPKQSVIVHPGYNTFDQSEESVNLIKRYIVDNVTEEDFLCFGNSRFMEQYIDHINFQSKEITVIVDNETHVLSYGQLDYLRGPLTIGVSCPYRRMHIVGSPAIPRHCQDYFAHWMLDTGLVSGSPHDISRELENQSFASALTQGGARVRDPSGQVESEVHIVGISPERVEQGYHIGVPQPLVYTFDSANQLFNYSRRRNLQFLTPEEIEYVKTREAQERVENC